MFQGHRATEKGRGPLGAELALDELPGGVRSILDRLVLAVHAAGRQVKARSESVLGLVNAKIRLLPPLGRIMIRGTGNVLIRSIYC